MVGNGGGTYVLYVQVLVDYKGDTLAYGEKGGRTGRRGNEKERRG
jgi:hypothetical protein